MTDLLDKARELLAGTDKTIVALAKGYIEAVEWQPIETAPRDGPAFLVWCPERENIYLVTPDIDCGWFIFGGRKLENEVPTHWRPLPTHPHPSTGGRTGTNIMTTLAKHNRRVRDINEDVT